MVNIKLILRVMGIFILLESVFLLLMTLVPICYNEDDAVYFLLSSLISAIFGASFFLIGRKAERTISRRESITIVASVWVIFALFGMMPYWLSGAIPSFTDAFFETISGFTTTGATVIYDVEALSHGMLFWRSFTHFIGGIGIIVLTIAILPFFGIRGSQLLSDEITGHKKDKIQAKISDTVKYILIFYISLNAIETILLVVSGMDLFNAVCQSFSTIATGGFSTKNAGIAYWNSAPIQYIISCFMILSGISFSIYFWLIKRNFSKIKDNEELRYYLLSFVVISIVVIISLIDFSKGINLTDLELSFRKGFFTTASLITTTGFGTVDYMHWQPFAIFLLVFAMIVGASAGSTSGGLKMSRIVIATKTCYYQFKRMVHPNAVIPIHYNKSILQNDIVTNVLVYLLLYLVIALAGLVILSLAGLSIKEAIGSMISCLSGVGAGPNVGPFGNYGAESVFVKWFLSFIMLLGRLEIFTILLLFTPTFWKS